MSLDLSAVCERHGITLLLPDGKGKSAEAFDGDNHRYGVTEAEAIGTLLVARWGMTTRPAWGDPGKWEAYSLTHIGRNTYGIATLVPGARGDTLIEAIVALADRLRPEPAAGEETPDGSPEA